MAMSRVDLAGALSLGGYGLLLYFSRSGEDVHIAMFLGIMFGAWALLGLACTASNIPAAKIWVWAIAFRVVGFFGHPILEDDWYRYLWDGAVFARSGNPYDKPPSGFFSDPQVPEKLQPLLDGINNPDVPTIYAPLCQYAFLVSYWIAPGELWPLKLILICADLLTAGLLTRMISRHGLLLYTWCPLLIKEVAFTAHPDILGIALMVAALRTRWPRAIAVCCALAAGVKIFAAVIAVLLLMRLPKKYWLLFAAVLAAMYLPFWLQGSTAEVDALRTFATSWQFNSMVYGILAIWLGPSWAAAVCAALFLIILGIYVSKPSEGPPRGDWIFGAFFLLSAVVNPWYLLWMLPFVALYPLAAGVAAVAIVSVAYVHGLNVPGTDLGPYDHPWWVRVVQVATIIVAAALQFLLRARTRQTPAPDVHPAQCK